MKITIDGMMCQHCVSHVENALSELDGLSDIKVDLESSCATISGAVDTDKIRLAIEDAGYNVISIEP